LICAISESVSELNLLEIALGLASIPACRCNLPIKLSKPEFGKQQSAEPQGNHSRFP
jgi:hypothetical protein